MASLYQGKDFPGASDEFVQAWTRASPDTRARLEHAWRRREETYDAYCAAAERLGVSPEIAGAKVLADEYYQRVMRGARTAQSAGAARGPAPTPTVAIDRRPDPSP